MNIGIIAVGRMKEGAEQILLSRYGERAKKIGKQIGLDGFNIIEIAEAKANNKERRKEQEAKLILANIKKNAKIIVLYEGGQNINSAQFTQKIADWRDEGEKELQFIIGGPDGLDKIIMAKADMVLSFSSLTWPHQLVRIMLMEQLYRLTTILTNHPYHK